MKCGAFWPARQPAAVKASALLPSAVAAVTVAAGAGVLGIWWALTSQPSDLQGWTDFRAATVGDGVLLPVLGGSLLAAARALQAKPGDHRQAAAWGILGLAVGMFLQASWLLDDQPQLNWTLQQAHSFTAAGWYHAFFLCAVLGARRAGRSAP